MLTSQNRRLPLAGESRHGPTYAVWELTLRCNQACRFCGTRAGRARPDELGTEEALDVIAQLGELGVREVAMHGGESYLREDWLCLVRAIRERDMIATMVTGGRGLSADIARAAADAGITAVSVSIDGLPATHDALRGIQGSYDSALRALDHLERAGVPVGANTQVNRQNLRELEALLRVLRQHPLYGWQVQLMVPMGRAADEPSLWLEPYDLLELMPMLAELRPAADAAGIELWPGDNVGYFGPFEERLRDGRVPEGHSGGCGGGILSIGIEAHGDVKGCSAMGTEGFVAGNVRRSSLRELWDGAPELKLARCFQPDWLWGFCATCYYAEVCKAGCMWTSATILGRLGNAPYCHHRALEYLRQGQREHLVRVREAPGNVRDRALFCLEVEDAPAEWVTQMRSLNGD